MASCMMALCAWRIGRKASPWVSHISVDPTMSVKRKVMVPAGGCKVLAFTGMPWGFRARVRSPGRLPQWAREFQEELTRTRAPIAIIRRMRGLLGFNRSLKEPAVEVLLSGYDLA